jgi:hypothetical protein
VVTVGKRQDSTYLNPVEGDKVPRGDGKVQVINGMATCMSFCCHNLWLQLQC